MDQKALGFQSKTGVVKVFFKDGTLSCVGKYRNGEKIGGRRTYGAKGKRDQDDPA